MPLAGCADVADVTKSACNEFPRWGVDAGQVQLFLAADGGEDSPSTESIVALVADPTKRLGEAWPLERARIGPGAWLLARVPPPPAAAPGASRRRRAGVLERRNSHTPLPIPVNVSSRWCL